jgi:hypothetical protein
MSRQRNSKKTRKYHYTGIGVYIPQLLCLDIDKAALNSDLSRSMWVRQCIEKTLYGEVKSGREEADRGSEEGIEA